MPYEDPDPLDPNMLVGVALPADADAVREMAIAFADEFARLGYDTERLLALFGQPFYRGAHQAWSVLGEAAVRDIVRDSVAFWGAWRVAVDERAAGLVQLELDDAGGAPVSREEGS